ncbi:MAG: hypothetical protein DMF04_08215 [Verrucomicrobia bacterium]|nr:MAG: hypothetical protein DMF04_08215 [Verrucomicrobiota bacterium]
MLVGLGRINNNRIERLTSQHYFGEGLLVDIGNMLKSNSAAQAGCGGLRQARSCPRTGLPLTVNALALMFGHSIDKAILERRSNHGPCTQ